MGLRITYKSEIWTNVKLPEGTNQQEIINALSKKNLTLDDVIIEDAESEILLEAEELILPEDNNGGETLEVFDGTDKIWDNAQNVPHGENPPITLKVACGAELTGLLEESNDPHKLFNFLEKDESNPILIKVFNTEAEQAAYLEGMDDAKGWDEMYVLD